MQTWAEIVARAMEAYAAAGLLFALAFLTVGMQRLDSRTRETRIGFRLMILPGVMILWPLLLRRWIGARRGGAS